MWLQRHRDRVLLRSGSWGRRTVACSAGVFVIVRTGCGVTAVVSCDR
jgi:hypothetical protein